MLKDRLFKFAPHSYRFGLEHIPHPEKHKITIVEKPDDAFLDVIRFSTDREAAAFLHAIALTYNELKVSPNFRIHLERHFTLGILVSRTYTDRPPGINYNDYLGKEIPIHPVLISIAA